MGGPGYLLPGRAQRAGSDALKKNLRFLWDHFTTPSFPSRAIRTEPFEPAKNPRFNFTYLAPPA
jgi:hypothetical protein